MSANIPYLSLAILARDPEGAATLERCLRSAQERPDGPMFDEIVCVLGGEPNAEVRAIAARFGARVYDLPADVPRRDDGGLADFAAARNYAYGLCRGVWIGYLDADDVVPTAERNAEVYHKNAGNNGSNGNGTGATTAEPVTFKAFLRSLPPQHNSVAFAYHYAYDHLDNVVVESFREWVRWRDGFVWVNRAPGHHEAIYPLYPNQRCVAELKGFHLEHRPPDGSAELRQRRNDVLLDSSRTMGADGWALYYYLARREERLGRYEAAAAHDETSVNLAQKDEERYTSFHCLSRVLRHLGRHREALSCALLAHNLAPLRGEAMADLIHVLLAAGDPARAADWYLRLLSLPPQAGQLGVEYRAYEVDLWPHVAGSRALLAVKRYEDAIAAAARALAFAPYDEGAQLAHADAVNRRDDARALEAARFLANYAARRDDAGRVAGLVDHLPYTVAGDHELRDLVDRLEHAPMTTPAISKTSARLLTEEVARSGAAAVPDPLGEVRGEHGFSTAIAEAQFAERVAITVPHGTEPGLIMTKRPVYTSERLLDLVAPRARNLERLERVPPDDDDHHRGGALVAVYEPGVSWLNAPLASVAIHCAEYAERWGPWSPERTGIGGSEEMVVVVARRLAALGTAVTVYAPVDSVCVDRNVIWRPLEAFDPMAPVDVLVSHRSGHLARRERLGAKRHYVWLHDAIASRMVEDFEAARVARVDGYLTLSRWQEENLHEHLGITFEKMIRTPNTSDPEDRLPADPALRRPHAAVYASAPHRGLDVLLEAWPRVRARVPDAELHVACGWQGLDALTRAYPVLAEIKRKIMARLNEPGVTWHGRVTSPRLRELLQASNVLAYPTTFLETSCRSAIRALACGAVPVYRPVGALPETISGDGRPVPGDDPGSKGYAEAFATAVVTEFENPIVEVDRACRARRSFERHDRPAWATWDRMLGLGEPAPALEESTP